MTIFVSKLWEKRLKKRSRKSVLIAAIDFPNGSRTSVLTFSGKQRKKHIKRPEKLSAWKLTICEGRATYPNNFMPDGFRN